MAGGSLADTPPLPTDLKKSLVNMRPTWEAGDTILRLSSEAGEHLCYAERQDSEFGLPADISAKHYRAMWIDAKTGEVTEVSEWHAMENLRMRGNVVWLTPID